MGFYVILYYLKGFYFLMSLHVKNNNYGRSFYWILYNNEIPYKGGNITLIFIILHMLIEHGDYILNIKCKSYPERLHSIFILCVCLTLDS